MPKKSARDIVRSCHERLALVFEASNTRLSDAATLGTRDVMAGIVKDLEKAVMMMEVDATT